MPRPLPAAVLAATEGDADAVRAHILAAALRAIRSKGLAGASTRAIADEAGVSGGTLYNYFGNRTQLVAKAIVAHAASLMGRVAALPARAGEHTVAENLTYFVREATSVLDELVPLVAASFSDGELLAVLRRELAGEVDPAAFVERYLLAERDLGRVRPDADCRAAAALVVAVCHDDAFHRHLAGPGGSPRTGEIALITRGLVPQI